MYLANSEFNNTLARLGSSSPDAMRNLADAFASLLEDEKIARDVMAREALFDSSFVPRGAAAYGRVKMLEDIIEQIKVYTR